MISTLIERQARGADREPAQLQSAGRLVALRDRKSRLFRSRARDAAADGDATLRVVELRIHSASGFAAGHTATSGRVVVVVKAQRRAHPQQGTSLLDRLGSTLGVSSGGGGGAAHESGGGGDGDLEELAVSGEAALQGGRAVLGAWARVPTDAQWLDISVGFLDWKHTHHGELIIRHHAFRPGSPQRSCLCAGSNTAPGLHVP